MQWPGERKQLHLVAEIMSAFTTNDEGLQRRKGERGRKRRISEKKEERSARVKEKNRSSPVRSTSSD